jgi:hypothetical protein
MEECEAGAARDSRGIEGVSKPRGLAARVVQVEGDTAEASLPIECAGVLTTSTVVIPVDGKYECIPGELAACVGLPASDYLPGAMKCAVGFLDDVEHEFEPVALRDGPLPVDVARHAVHLTPLVTDCLEMALSTRYHRSRPGPSP